LASPIFTSNTGAKAAFGGIDELIDWEQGGWIWGLFQKDVAEIIGVSVDTICYWENGRVTPTSLLRRKIAAFLDSK
jgi:transcriptional regulator with XRE-family HTH domain